MIHLRQKKARNLWSEAFASLHQNDCEILRLGAGDGAPADKASQTTMVQKVRELTEEKYEEHCKRGRYTKKGNTTQERNIRIKAQEIIFATLQFDGIVQAGLKFDPTGYGTTVWGVLSGVLTLVQNDKDRADAVFDSAAVLARFLPKYAIIEDHYLDRQTQEQGPFEDQVRDVYTSILKYAACVQKELNRSRAGNKNSSTFAFTTCIQKLTYVGRVLGSFWSLDNQDIKILKDELEASDKIVTDQSSFVAHQYRRQEFQKLDTKASEALNSIDISVRKLLEAEKLTTLKWLSDSSVTDKQQQLRSKVEKLNKDSGKWSGKWLLESEEYKSWFRSPHSFLWLYGTSGCGKSILCSTVVKDLVDSAAEKSNMAVAYRYFDNADPQTQSIQGLIRLILRRISAKAMPVPGPVHDLARRHEAAGSTPGTAALIKTLKETVTALEEDLYLVLDAIDEYQTGNETVREEFLDFLVEMGDAKMHNLHILVTSVPETYIKDAFMRLQLPPASMDVETPVSVDVDAYLDTTIDKYATDKKWSSEIQTEIEQTLKKDG